ncbi:DUF3575 domain-containing protein [Ferruginibacter sp. SUN002]|uniref:DUF3575 domain-containing protein n=1 Tax=Ferruginibacter sp. SUN002 TaxID=2937789 RepID=UPI003D365EF6
MTKVFLLLLSVATLQANSQNTKDTTGVTKNLVKLNLSSLVVGNYMAQYERVIGKRSSLALAIGYAPNASLPFKNALLDQFGDNQDAKEAIESTVYTKWTYTLEYRYYLGKKGAPKGFYVAPFARYMSMELDHEFRFTPSDNIRHTAAIHSKFNAFGGGVMFGTQWLIKKNWGIDFWIVGGFYGSDINAKFHGTDPIGGLDAQDMADLEADIEDVDLPGFTIDATVTQHPSGAPATADATLKGNWYGLRGAGICVVYRF